MPKSQFFLDHTEQYFDLFNEMVELIYAADMDTYDLLFVNEIGRESFGLHDFEGLKCYEALQGRTEPCPFCTNAYLSYERLYSWEFTNEKTKKHYLLKDKMVNWGGRRIRVEIAVDNSEQEREQNALRTALAAEHMVLECIRILSDTDCLDHSLTKVLECIGCFFMADRSYLFQLREEKMLKTHEWCAEHIEAHRCKLQTMDLGELSYWQTCVKQKECMIVADPEELRGESEDCQILMERGLRSLVAVPLERNGELTGYIGIENPSADKIQNISPLFQTLGDFLVFAKRIDEDDKQLTRLSFHDALTGAFNRNRYTRDAEEFIEKNVPIGVVFLDVNGLKEVNDRLGHYWGDQLLIQCARKSMQIFGEESLYRMGGDEFIILAAGVEESSFLMLVNQLKVLFHQSDSCSVAVGYQWAASSARLQELTTAADTMMYEEKRIHYRKNPARRRHGGEL